MRFTFIPLLILIAGCDIQPADSLFRATGETIAFGGGDGGPTAACFTCHGIAGEGDGRDAPRLAASDAGYLHRQLNDYATGRRGHAAMRAIALRLDDSDRGKVAAYYAALPAPAAVPSPGDDTGKRLYLEGDPARGLIPCAECHGRDGEGSGAGNPPLAGQPAPYLANQLNAWREGRRYNDPLGEMGKISRLLSQQEVRVLAAHAASLPAPHPPAVRATYPAAHRADPKNDASAPPPHESGSSPPAR